MNPSGGLAWHWRAWRRQQDWAPTRAAIAHWLASGTPTNRHLLLLGPSAGWMLPTDWLQRFESVTAVDLDPWARRLFALRHGRRLSAAGVRWRYLTQDALSTLPALLEEHPEACVLFDNLLGQLRFHAGKLASAADTAAMEARLQALTGLLKGREWGSLHDLVSGPVSRTLSADESAIFPPVRMSFAGEAVASGLFPVGAQGPWLDHLTAKVLPPGTPVQRMAWRFSADYGHVLEAGWVRPSQILPSQVMPDGDDFKDDDCARSTALRDDLMDLTRPPSACRTAL